MWPLSAAQSTSAMICPKTPSRAAAMKSHYPSRPGNATAWSSTQASRLIMSTWRWKMALSPLLSTWALEPLKPLWNQWTESSTTTRGMMSKSPATSGRWVHRFGNSTNDFSGFGSTDMWFKTVAKVAKQNGSETQIKFNNWISMAKKSGKQLLAVSSVLSSTCVCVCFDIAPLVCESSKEPSPLPFFFFLHLFFFSCAGQFLTLTSYFSLKRADFGYAVVNTLHCMVDMTHTFLLLWFAVTPLCILPLCWFSLKGNSCFFFFFLFQKVY